MRASLAVSLSRRAALRAALSAVRCYGTRDIAELQELLGSVGSDARTVPEHDLLFRFLRHMPGTAKEVARFLKQFSAAERHRFAVVKVGGAVIEEEVSTLAQQLAFLHRVGLYPVVVHGGGPQLNRLLEEAGVKYDFCDGLRVTTEEVLEHALPLFEESNSALVDALEARGVRARPILSGVFKADPLDREKYGLVGDVKSVTVEPIMRSINAKALPIVASIGYTRSGMALNINADVAASTMAQKIAPLRTVFINSSGGLADEHGKMMPVVSMADDYDRLMSQPWFKHGSRLKLKQIKDILDKLPSSSSVAIAKASDLLKELFTFSGAGTVFRHGTPVHIHRDPAAIQKEFPRERLESLISTAFERHLSPTYFDRLLQPGVFDALYATSGLSSLAIMRHIPGSDLPYMDKFVVARNSQRLGIGEIVLNKIIQDYPKFFWRSRTSNSITAWYTQIASGFFATPGWKIFWIGDLSFEELSAAIPAAQALPDAFDGELSQGDAAQVVPHVQLEDAPKKRIGIVGARGYTGNELMKLLLKHPKFELAAVSSRQLEGKRISSYLKGFYAGSDAVSDLELRYCNLQPEDIAEYTQRHKIDAWVMALPNGVCRPFVAALEPSTVVVDLSADYRFEQAWQYGLPERFRESIAGKTRIANPGCYATGAQMGILPFKDILDDSCPPQVFGVSGYSGAGTTPSDKNDPKVLKDNLIPYALSGHVHEREVSNQLGTPIRFMPHVAPYFQGIQLTISLKLKYPLASTLEAKQLVQSRFLSEPLVKITDDIPRVKDNARKHHVCIGGFTLDGSRTQLSFGVTIDNLLKGAATQALQNLNLALGNPELAGIAPHLRDEAAEKPQEEQQQQQQQHAPLSREQAAEMDKAYIIHTYGERPAILHRGEGARAYDDEAGKQYLDFVSGIAVNALGHSDAELAETVAEQARKLVHTSNLYYTEPQLKLAQALLGTTTWAKKVFFSNSGAEANESALKFARKHGKKIAEDKTEVVSFKQGFHGRTMGALSVTYKPAYRAPFEPLVPFGDPELRFATVNDLASVEKALSDKTCAVILEPIQGEGGVNPVEAGFLRDVRQLCSEKQALLIADEVQCGLGRTGDLWAHEALLPEASQKPDILTLAKPIAGGLPLAAVMMSDEVAQVMEVGEHGTTFAGSPLACSAALHVVQRIMGDGFLDGVQRAGQYLRQGLEKLPNVEQVRGKGLMLGVDVAAPHTSASTVKACREHGVLFHTAGPQTIRVLPPLNVTLDEMDEALQVLHTVLSGKSTE